MLYITVIILALSIEILNSEFSSNLKLIIFKIYIY